MRTHLIIYKLCSLLLIGLISSTASANIDALEFKTAAQQAQYQKLILELRCVVCQNQNLADSNADLAKDLRSKTYDMVLKGQSDDAILEYMQTRYGDFVLYRPPFNMTTALLWLGPFVLLVLSLSIMLYRIKRREQDELIKPVKASDTNTRLQVQNLLKNSPELINSPELKNSPEPIKSPELTNKPIKSPEK